MIKNPIEDMFETYKEHYSGIYNYEAKELTAFTHGVVAAMSLLEVKEGSKQLVDIKTGDTIDLEDAIDDVLNPRMLQS